MCDLDCLVLEYDHRLPVAIMELKSQHWSGYMETANNEAIAALSNRASLPAFVVWLVDPAREKLIVKPLNELARGYIPCDSLMMEHSRYAHLLALLRSGTVEAIDE